MNSRVMCRPHFYSTQRYSVKQVMDLWVTGTIRFQCLVLTDQFIPAASNWIVGQFSKLLGDGMSSDSAVCILTGIRAAQSRFRIPA